LKFSGGTIVAKLLRSLGVSYVFGMPGGQTLPIYMGILDEHPHMRHVLFRCEKCAVYAADAYARVSSRPGVCDGTVGPGATNMVSGVAEAWGASIPLIVMTSDIHTWMVGKWASQECDQMAMMKPFVKAGFYLSRTDRIADAVQKAFRIATTGRPGPVHLDFPMDVVMDEAEFDPDLQVDVEHSHYPSVRTAPDSDSVNKASELILRAERPVLVAGGGVVTSGAWDELRRLAELLAIPVVTTIMGKGSMPEDHPLSLGVGGSSGKTCANKAMSDADLVVFVGCKTGQFATMNWTLPRPGTRIVHVDVDPGEIGRNFPTDVGVVGDARLSLKALVDRLKEMMTFKSSCVAPRLEEVRRAVKVWRDSVEPRMVSDEVPIRPTRLVREMRRFLSDDAILTCDASLASFWGAIFFDVRRAGRYFLAPRGMAGIGAGFSFALGAKVAAADRQVMGLGGDGGFGMSLHELETARRMNLPVVYAVLNDSALGWIKLGELATFKRTISADFTQLDFSKIAEAFGCNGIRVERPGEIAEAISDGFRSGVPTVLDVVTGVELPSPHLV